MPQQLDDNQKSYYLTMSEGKARQKVEESTPGATSRIVTNPETNVSKPVWELVYKSAEGYITGIEELVDKFKNRVIKISMYKQDDDENFTLQLRTNSGYGSAFFEIIPNVDFSMPVRIVGYSFIPEGKTKNKTGVNIFQPKDSLDLEFTVKLSKKWTKENPGLKPQWDPEEVDQWKLDTRKFLIKYMTENVLPKIQSEPWNADGSNLFDDNTEKSIKEQVMDKQKDMGSDKPSDLPFIIIMLIGLSSTMQFLF